MSQPTYVIRAYHFGYNDECFYVCGSYINSIYHNREEAESKYQELEVAYLRGANLGELGEFFDGGKDYLKKMDDYVFAKTGTHILENEFVDYGVTLPAQMSDREVMEFAQLGDIHAYQLVEFKAKPVFYALWDCGAEQFQMRYDEYSTSLVYAPSRESAMANLKDLMDDKRWQTQTIKGTLEDLSATPVLLKQAIAATSSFSYDESLPGIKLKRAKATDLAALNELLKKPLFEIRELEPATILELEAELKEDFYEDFL